MQRLEPNARLLISGQSTSEGGVEATHALLDVQLTCELGQQAAEMLLQILSDGSRQAQRAVLDAKLVVRDWSGPPRLRPVASAAEPLAAAHGA